VFYVDLSTNSDYSLYSINRLVLIIETASVYCAVRTGSLNITQVNLSLQMCNFALKTPPAGSSRCSKTGSKAICVEICAAPTLLLNGVVNGRRHEHRAYFKVQ